MVRQLLFFIAIGTVACGAPADRVAPYEPDFMGMDAAPNGNSIDHVDAGGGADGACTTMKSGCSCVVEGETVQCAVEHAQNGDYKRCSPSFMTCRGGLWSECVGDRIVGAN
jgi:hypothetical protein